VGAYEGDSSATEIGELCVDSRSCVANARDDERTDRVDEADDYLGVRRTTKARAQGMG